MMVNRKTLFRYLLAGLALISVLLVGWWFARCLDWIGVPFGKRTFDTLTWRNMKVSKHREIRAEMADDLIRHHLKPGMPENQVLSLLGPQNKTWSKSEYTTPLPHDTYEYDMGQAPMDMAGQHYVFRLYFDKLGHYQSPEITRD